MEIVQVLAISLGIGLGWIAGQLVAYLLYSIIQLIKNRKLIQREKEQKKQQKEI